MVIYFSYLDQLQYQLARSQLWLCLALGLTKMRMPLDQSFVLAKANVMTNVMTNVVDDSSVNTITLCKYDRQYNYANMNQASSSV